MESVKIVAVGDGAVGKTCMMVSYTTNTFPEDYAQTIFDNYTCTIALGDKIVSLNLFDTAGQPELDRLRPLSYTGCDCILLVFSLVSRASFENLESTWLPEVQHHCPGVPIVLVGTKSDLLETKQNSNVVSEVEAVMLKNSIGAKAFVACSALTHDKLSQPFVEAASAALEYKKKQRTSSPTKSQSVSCGAVSSCCIL